MYILLWMNPSSIVLITFFFPSIKLKIKLKNLNGKIFPVNGGKRYNFSVLRYYRSREWSNRNSLSYFFFFDRICSSSQTLFSAPFLRPPFLFSDWKWIKRANHSFESDIRHIHFFHTSVHHTPLQIYASQPSFWIIPIPPFAKSIEFSNSHVSRWISRNRNDCWEIGFHCCKSVSPLSDDCSKFDSPPPFLALNSIPPSPSSRLFKNFRKMGKRRVKKKKKRNSDKLTRSNGGITHRFSVWCAKLICYLINAYRSASHGRVVYINYTPEDSISAFLITLTYSRVSIIHEEPARWSRLDNACDRYTGIVATIFFFFLHDIRWKCNPNTRSAQVRLLR